MIMVKTFILSNGVKVVTYNIPQIKSIHLTVGVKGGSFGEEQGKNGVAHFMEHMLLQGIPLFPNAEELSTAIEKLAGGYNAYTSMLLITFAISLPFIHLEEAVKIASEVMFSPLFPQASLEKERKAVLSEIAQLKDSLSYKLEQQFRVTRFTTKSVLQRDVGGITGVVQNITREDLLRYWERYFLPENTYIYIGGNFSESDVRSYLDTYFASQKKNRQFSGYPDISKKDFAEKTVTIKTDKSLGTNYITLSFPALSLDDDWKQIVLQDLALILLGKIRTSRLFKLLRYQKGLVYNISARQTLLPGVGYIDISSEVATEHIEEVTATIAKTVHDFISNGPTDEEMKLVTHYAENSWLMAFDSPESASDWLEQELLWEDKVRMPEEYIAMVKHVTKKDIMSAMKNFWDFEKLQLLIHGPLEESKNSIKKFQKLLSPLYNF